MIISRELDALITAEHKAGYYATVQQMDEMRHWQDERKAIKEKIACAFDELRQERDSARSWSAVWKRAAKEYRDGYQMMKYWERRALDAEAQRDELLEWQGKVRGTIAPYSEQLLAELEELENRYDIEVVSVEHSAEWVDRYERVKEQRDELLAACKDLIEYRNRNTLNFQLEKADDFINRMRRIIDDMEKEK